MSAPSQGTKGSTNVGASVAKLSFISIFLLGINGIIGSGTFLLPQEIYEDAGFLLGMGVILFAGIATTLIAFCYADLSGKFSGGGGAWLYSYTAFGKFTGFQVGFFMWFSGIVSIAAEVAALIRIFRNVIPALKSDVLSIICGTVLIVLLGLINWFGMKSVKWVSNLSSATKIGAALFFVVVGVFFMKWANLGPVSAAHGGSVVEQFSTTYAIVFYMFTGFSFLPIAARKMKNPQKNLPRALISIMLSVTAIYLLVQFVVVGNLGTETAKSTIPVAEAMLKSVGEWGYYIIIVGSAVSVFGVAFTSAFEVPVIASTLADEHNLLPPIFAKNNKFGAPFVSIILTVVVSAALLWTGSYVFLATCMVCANFIQYVPTILAVVKLRKMPSAPGAMSLKGARAWVVAGLALVSSLYVLTGFNWKVIAVAAAVFVIATVVYFWDEASRKKHGLTLGSSTGEATKVAVASAIAGTVPASGSATTTGAATSAPGTTGAATTATTASVPGPTMPVVDGAAMHAVSAGASHVSQTLATSATKS